MHIALASALTFSVLVPLFLVRHVIGDWDLLV